jgi:hypothetical protein
LIKQEEKTKMRKFFSYFGLPVKHPLELRAFEFKTGSIAFSEHGENLLLFRLSPDVARANIMKLPSSPPGVH